MTHKERWDAANAFIKAGEYGKARELYEVESLESDARIIEKRCQAAEASNANRSDCK